MDSMYYLIVATKDTYQPTYEANRKGNVWDNKNESTLWQSTMHIVDIFNAQLYESTGPIIRKCKAPTGQHTITTIEDVFRSYNKILREFIKDNGFNCTGYNITAIPLREISDVDAIDEFALNLTVKVDSKVHAFAFIEHTNKKTIVHKKMISTAQRNLPRPHKTAYVDCQSCEIIKTTYISRHMNAYDSYDSDEPIFRYYLVVCRKPRYMRVREMIDFNEKTFACTDMTDEIKVTRKIKDNVMYWDYFSSKNLPLPSSANS